MNESVDWDRYFESRFGFDRRRSLLWGVLVDAYFQDFVDADFTAIELGAGYCDFINSIKCSRRIAVDVWPGFVDFAGEGVETLNQPAWDLSQVPNGAVDYVFASNLLEHLTLGQAGRVVDECFRVLKPGGMLQLMQPNFRACGPRYFDDYTHVTIWTDVSLNDFVRARGFSDCRMVGRFMPFSLKGSLPVVPFLIRAYLRSPIKPRAGQMLLTAIR